LGPFPDPGTPPPGGLAPRDCGPGGKAAGRGNATAPLRIAFSDEPIPIKAHCVHVHTESMCARETSGGNGLPEYTLRSQMIQATGFDQPCAWIAPCEAEPTGPQRRPAPSRAEPLHRTCEDIMATQPSYQLCDDMKVVLPFHVAGSLRRGLAFRSRDANLRDISMLITLQPNNMPNQISEHAHTAAPLADSDTAA